MILDIPANRLGTARKTLPLGVMRHWMDEGVVIKKVVMRSSSSSCVPYIFFFLSVLLRWAGGWRGL